MKRYINKGVMVVLMIASLYLLFSCKWLRPATTESNTKKDSISTSYKETVRDTPVYLEVDSAAIRAEVKCDSNGKVVFVDRFINSSGKISDKGKRSNLDIQLKNNQIIAKCKCDTAAIILPLKEKYFKEFRSSAEKQVVIKKERINCNIHTKIFIFGVIVGVLGLVILKVLIQRCKQ